MTDRNRSASPSGDDSDQYVRVLTACVPVLLAYIDTQHRYRFVNEAYARWFGRDTSAVVGRHVSELIGGPAYQGVRQYLDVALAGVAVTFEREMPYADVEARYVHVAFVPDVGQDGLVRGVSAAVTDITDRKAAEKRDQKAQKELALVVSGARCLLWHADVILRKGGELHWETRFADEEALHVFGIAVPPGQDLAAAWRQSRVMEDRLRDDKNAERRVRAGEDYTQEFRCRRADGGLVWMKEDVRVEALGEDSWHLVGVTTDITDRKLAEEERERMFLEAREGAERQRAFLRDVLASVTDGKLRLVSEKHQLPPASPPLGDSIPLSKTAGLRELRHRTREAAREARMTDERINDLMTAASEAGMNAIVHADGGTGQVSRRPGGGVQVRVEDRGGGIAMENLPRAALARGYSTRASLGHGMKMMLQMADRVFLLTGTDGTTVVLEQDADPPDSTPLVTEAVQR